MTTSTNFLLLVELHQTCMHVVCKLLIVVHLLLLLATSCRLTTTPHSAVPRMSAEAIPRRTKQTARSGRCFSAWQVHANHCLLYAGAAIIRTDPKTTVQFAEWKRSVTEEEQLHTVTPPGGVPFLPDADPEERLCQSFGHESMREWWQRSCAGYDMLCRSLPPEWQTEVTEQVKMPYGFAYGLWKWIELKCKGKYGPVCPLAPVIWYSEIGYPLTGLRLE
jgi:hypothetical protein